MFKITLTFLTFKWDTRESVWLQAKGGTSSFIRFTLALLVSTKQAARPQKTLLAPGGFPLQCFAPQSNDQGSLQAWKVLLLPSRSPGANLYSHRAWHSAWMRCVTRWNKKYVFGVKDIMPLKSSWIFSFTSCQSVRILWCEAARAAVKSIAAVTGNLGCYSALSYTTESWEQW